MTYSLIIQLKSSSHVINDMGWLKRLGLVIVLIKYFVYLAIYIETTKKTSSSTQEIKIF
jgi:hypothetical protein